MEEMKKKMKMMKTTVRSVPDGSDNDYDFHFTENIFPFTFTTFGMNEIPEANVTECSSPTMCTNDYTYLLSKPSCPYLLTQRPNNSESC